MKVLKTPKSVELMYDNFGSIHTVKGNKPVKRFTWKNQNRIQVQVITYGATITSIRFPNKKGILDDVVIGFDDAKGYTDNHSFYCGCVIGRFANFIKNSKFILNKKEYILRSNLANHHYNGGVNGLDRINWDWYVNGNKVILSTMSPDKDQGYPGDLSVFITFELTVNNEFKIDIKALSTKLTVVNISHHTYFNLAGHQTGQEELQNHTVLLNADCYTITADDFLPTGEIKSVQGTIYDFQIPVLLKNILCKYGGMNANLCLTRSSENNNCFVGRIAHLASGRIIEVYSNQHGVQFDTANDFPNYYNENSHNETKNTNASTKCPYIKSNIATFDLLDEIYVRVKSALEESKDSAYTDLLDLIRELQKKSKTISRVNECNSLEGAIKRGAIKLDDGYIHLTPLQRRYLEKILDVMSKYIKKDTGPLADLRYLIANVTNGQSRQNINTSDTSCPGSKCSSDSRLQSATEKLPTKGIRGKKGSRYHKHCGIALQTQNYPDSININHFPTCVLKPGCIYHHSIVYKFWVKSDQTNGVGII